jgi:hypothetical protein
VVNSAEEKVTLSQYIEAEGFSALVATGVSFGSLGTRTRMLFRVPVS